MILLMICKMANILQNININFTVNNHIVYAGFQLLPNQKKISLAGKPVSFKWKEAL